MEADVSICSKPGRIRVLSLIAVGGLAWALLLGSAPSQADGAPQAPQSSQTTTAAKSSPAPSSSSSKQTATSGTTASSAAAVQPGSAREEQLAAKIAELDGILLERQKLEDTLRVEKSAQTAAKMQLADAKKLIRLEVEDFFRESSNSERLDGLLGEYKRESDNHAAALARVESIEKDLAGQHLKFSQAERDVERLRAQLAAEVRERNSKKIQAIARKLDKTLQFEESVSFRCSPNKSLAACLAEQRDDGRMSQWVLDNYQRVLAADISDQVDSLTLSPNWYRYRTKVDFSQASMNLDGTVNAQLSVKATVIAKKMMACAILEVPYDLCDSKTHSLIVRSNKYDDQVLINDQDHGSTPVSVVLDSGVYHVQVISGGITQKRTLSLQGDQVVHFKF